MSLRQQQVAVFFGTVVVIYGLFAAGLWLIAQRLMTEATLQTALVMARQVEIALADSLRQRPNVSQPGPASTQPKSFWSFLGNIFPGRSQPKSSSPGRAPSRHAEVKGLMRAFVDRSGSIEAMWVLNADGKVLYSSMGPDAHEAVPDTVSLSDLRRGVTTINSRQYGNAKYYDALVPLQMPAGVAGPGGLRLWINPADWTELLTGLWRQLALLFALGGGVALLSAILTTALYTRRFRLISETLRRAEAGTYEARPQYSTRDEVGTTLDLIDRLVMKQRKNVAIPAPVQRMAVAARTLAHEVRAPLHALKIHIELMRNAFQSETGSASKEHQQQSLKALETSIRQVDELVRDFTDYSAPVAMQKQPIDCSQVLHASLEALSAPCIGQQISLIKDLAPGPWPIQGDATRLRQAFDNLLRNSIEAQPQGGEIRITVRQQGADLVLRFADSGPGVAPELQASMFEFGHTTKSGGSGIGLPLAQLIVEAHGGSLMYEAQNGAGRGATFVLTLPLEVSA